jgi:hypothetical protein
MRISRKGWGEIAQWLEKEKGVKVTSKTVLRFFQRARKAVLPLGFEPNEPKPSVNHAPSAPKPPVLPAFPVTGPNELLKDDKLSFEEAFEEMAADPNALLEDDQPSGAWGPKKLRKRHETLE